MQNIKSTIKEEITYLFTTNKTEFKEYRQRVFGFDRRYDNLGECDFSDRELTRIAVKFIVYDMILGSSFDGPCILSNEILSGVNKEKADTIKTQYGQLIKSEAMATLRKKFCNEKQIKRQFTIDDIINEIKKTEPSLWDYIKNCGEIIWEHIRDCCKEQVNHEETSLERVRKQAESFVELREFVNDYELQMKNSIGSVRQ